MVMRAESPTVKGRGGNIYEPHGGWWIKTDTKKLQDGRTAEIIETMVCRQCCMSGPWRVALHRRSVRAGDAPGKCRDTFAYLVTFSTHGSPGCTACAENAEPISLNAGSLCGTVLW